MIPYDEAAIDLSDSANQMVVDLSDDVARHLQTLRDFARSQGQSTPDPKFGAKKETVDPEAMRDLVRDRLRRADGNFAKAANLITERRKEIAEILASLS
jgi:hypothetical protein